MAEHTVLVLFLRESFSNEIASRRQQFLSADYRLFLQRNVLVGEARVDQLLYSNHALVLA